MRHPASLIAFVELRKLLRRAIIKVLLAVPAIPVVLALAMRPHYSSYLHALKAAGIDTSRFWLLPLGSTAGLEVAGAARMLPPELVLGQFVNLPSVAWLVSVIVAVLAYASDVASGRFALLAVRPASRRAIVAGKLAALLLLLALLYTESALASYLSAWILAGKQYGVHLAPIYGVLMAAASLPMLCAVALLGLKLRSTSTTFVLGIVLYFAASAVPSVAIAVIGRGLEETLYRLELVSAANALASPRLPALAIDALLLGLGARHALMAFSNPPTVGTLLTISAASLAAHTALLLALLLWYSERFDVKPP